MCCFRDSWVRPLVDERERDPILSDGVDYQRSIDIRDGWFAGACKKSRDADPLSPRTSRCTTAAHRGSALDPRWSQRQGRPKDARGTPQQR